MTSTDTATRHAEQHDAALADDARLAAATATSDAEVSESSKQRALRGKNLEAAVRALIEPVVTAAGFDLIEQRMLRGPRSNTRLQLFIDRMPGEGGVVVSDCAAVSRKVGALLEIEDPIPGNYDLEVSSPGMKRLLRHLADVRRFLGLRARLTLPETPDSPKRTLIGTLDSCDDTHVQVSLEEGGETSVCFAELQRATLDPTLEQWQRLGEQLLQERAAREASNDASDGDTNSADVPSGDDS